MQKSTSIDTYALEFFLSLMETRSLAASADDFAVSSATAQRMLQKLRAHFADPLFTREGFAMRPTAKAERIAVKLRPLLAGLRRLGRDAEEDYSTRRETLRFAAYDNACASIFASLFPRLMARAPNLTLQFLQADERMFELLRAGDLDFVIYARQGLSPTSGRRRFSRRPTSGSPENPIHLKPRREKTASFHPPTQKASLR